MKGKLIIVIPVYKEQPDELELLSWQQIWKVVHNHPVCLVAPDNMNTAWYSSNASRPGDFSIEKYPARYFKNVKGYSRLLLHPRFYKPFLGFEFMLIYQLDAFIFRNDLDEWCDRNWDYIGAPFFFNYVTIFDKAPYGGVGNGGFSLRKIDSLLRVINGHSRIYSWKQIREQSQTYSWKGKLLYYAFYLGGFVGLFNTTYYRFNSFAGFEDYFWGYFVGPKLRWFTFPDYLEALKFSFEYNCEKLYQDNQGELPTGCHAWWKTDRRFWQPHFLKLGIDIDATLNRSVTNMAQS